MIIERYIIREIVKPTVTICTLLMFIFGCYMATRYLADAVQGQLPGFTVLLLILLRIAIALEVLLPTTLYLSVVIALGRMHQDAEMTALFACGVGPSRVLKSVLWAAVTAGGIVACFSLFVRPWAWDQFFGLKARAKANFDMTRMAGGNFYTLEDGARVIFAETVDSSNNLAKGVFIQNRLADTLQVIAARQASQHRDPSTGKPVLRVQDGTLYEFSRSGAKGTILKFETSTLLLEPKDPVLPTDRVKTLPTGRLGHWDDLEKVAELQWRLVQPVSTILLALLGVPLSRSSPRRGKYAKLPAALIIFAVYYNLNAMAKKLVAQGDLPVWPGVFWVQVLLGVLLLLLLWRPRPFFRQQEP